MVLFLPSRGVFVLIYLSVKIVRMHSKVRTVLRLGSLDASQIVGIAMRRTGPVVSTCVTCT